MADDDEYLNITLKKALEWSVRGERPELDVKALDGTVKIALVYVCGKRFGLIQVDLSVADLGLDNAILAESKFEASLAEIKRWITMDLGLAN